MCEVSTQFDVLFYVGIVIVCIVNCCVHSGRTIYPLIFVSVKRMCCIIKMNIQSLQYDR